jgi:hypothetical protein
MDRMDKMDRMDGVDTMDGVDDYMDLQLAQSFL